MEKKKDTNVEKVNETPVRAEEVIEGDGKVTCGVIMPIATIDGCNEHHWKEVKAIIVEAVEMAGFKPEFVWDADESGIIQSRIINNIYSNPIIVCDVSCKNPNVMFELGMRLAFDKPTIIIKDDATNYSFDTSPIEHLTYPRDLRYSQINDFKRLLAEKIKRTYEKASNDPDYSTFLKNFGTFRIAKISEKEITKEDYILEELQSIKKIINRERIPNNGVIMKNHRGTFRSSSIVDLDEISSLVFSCLTSIRNTDPDSFINSANKDLYPIVYKKMVSEYGILLDADDFRELINLYKEVE